METSFCKVRNNLSAHWYRVKRLWREGQATIQDYNTALGRLTSHQLDCPTCRAHLDALNHLGSVKEHEADSV